MSRKNPNPLPNHKRPNPPPPPPHRPPEPRIIKDGVKPGTRVQNDKDLAPAPQAFCWNVSINLGVWLHFKTGKYYQVIGLAENCTNANDGQIMVIYRPNDPFSTSTYVRDYNEFISKFKWTG